MNAYDRNPLDTGTCIICEKEMKWKFYRGDDYLIECPRCGKYKISREANEDLREYGGGCPFTPRQTANISGYLRENQNYFINTKNIQNLISTQTPSFHERADKLLLYLQRVTNHIGEFLERDESWYGYSWSFLEDELQEILNFLVSTKRIKRLKEVGQNQNYYKILPDGWAHLEKLKETNPDSQQCFVAMAFNEDMREVYDSTMSEAILDAGYKPHLVNEKEYNDKIDDEIIRQIRRSRFILADFTGQRQNVYYEVGFAKGLGLEVFWTCRNDEIEKGEVKFDTRQYNFITWENEKLSEFKDNITKRIEAVLGCGTYRKNSSDNSVNN